MADLLQHWQLATKPFEATWDTRFYHRSPQHQEALDRLLYLANERTMSVGLLTGDIGCGKTITSAMLAESLDPCSFVVVSCENSGFSFDELLQYILRQLEPDADHLPESKFGRCEHLKALCESAAERGRHVIILLDEAQDIPEDTLRQLGWLTNFNGNGRPLLTLLLIGQPPLRRLVNSNQAIQQRIGLRFHLMPLSEADTAAYVAHRLKAAGHADGSLFDADTLAHLHHLSRGIPREINRTAKLCLEHAWASGAEKVSAQTLHDVACDLYRQDQLLGMSTVISCAT
ncbi:ExeA family protein [Prosthecobacter sp.]|uniref:ExeA family protein n=1 Tax=Prosthecobacter sp. TaxID=1965333 RepID=UPI0037840C51